MLIKIRVPNVPFQFFDKLKYEMRNKVLIFFSMIFVSEWRHKT